MERKSKFSPEVRRPVSAPMRLVFLGPLLCLLGVANVAFAQDGAAGRGSSEQANPPAKKTEEGRVEVAGMSGAESAAAREIHAHFDTEDFEYRMGIAEIDRRLVKQLELAAEPLVDDKGKQHPLGFGVDEKTTVQASATLAKPLGAGERKTLLLRARLPELGTYMTTLTPYWGGAPRQKIVLKITRERPALNLAVADAATFAQDGGTRSVTFSLSLRETTGRSLSLDAPTLVSLVQQMGPDSKAPTLNRHAQFAVELDGKRRLSREGFELAKGQSRTALFHLDDFPGPGKYEAKLQFGSKDATPFEKVVTLYVREHWGIASLLIAIGVLVSWLLRWWVSEEQPRLKLLDEAAPLGPALESALQSGGHDDLEKNLVATVRTLLAELVAGVSRGRRGADPAAIESMAQRVSATRNFVTVRRYVRGVPANISQGFLDQLEEIRILLVDPTAEIAKLKEQEAALRAMPGKVAEELAKLAQAGGKMGGPGGGVIGSPRLEDELALSLERLQRGAVTEIAVNLVIIVIAVLLGVKALYLDDLTWGGAGSMLLAFLWGLGLHQFTYGGIGSVLDKVSKGGAST